MKTMNTPDAMDTLDTMDTYRSLEDLPLTLRVMELMPILGIGRNKAYELIRCGQIPSIRIGKQLRIPKEALIEYLSATN